LGLTDEQLKELIAVTGFANSNNRLAAGYQVEIDERFKS
jgi:alkylhydroperoxidase family enzyme